ncbi:MAG TPA: DHHA1 domain-containing protein, partial [Thermodesulfovibrionales bacterium]|nr:DHHA1 domain-containing protein [Thermodesulfovibrionales bacterium]
AIVVDTGTFRYSNTTAEVLRVAAELVDAGADPEAIAVNLYETWPEARFRLLLMVLDTLEIIDRIAITHVTKGMFAETGTMPEDTEHFSNFPRMIGTIAVSVFFREEEDGWKVSLRSRGEIDVAATAQGFKGGGHRNAAGFNIKADLETAKARVISALLQSAPAPSE